MTIFHYGSKPKESHEQFFQRLTETGEATPDPAWDYLQLWAAVGDMVKLSGDLKAKIAQAEDASPETDQAIREQLLLIQTVLSKALGLTELGERRSCRASLRQ